jgi:hypothetical protein
MTLQNLHPRVQCEPISMIVAVAASPSPPPQHSPIFGHLASSHTVDSFLLRIELRIWLYRGRSLNPLGIFSLSHGGRGSSPRLMGPKDMAEIEVGEGGSTKLSRLLLSASALSFARNDDRNCCLAIGSEVDAVSPPAV